MTPVKRIEIIVDSVELPDLLRQLDAHGVSGYTVMRNVTGRGERGARTSDHLTDVFTNCYVLTTCPAAQLDALIATIRPILKRFGGVCLVSDAQWVIH